MCRSVSVLSLCSEFIDFQMKNCMVIGYDVYHDSANRGKTVGSAVFSLNPHLTRWYSQCALHGESKQLISNLEEFCESTLRSLPLLRPPCSVFRGSSQVS